MPDWRTEDDDEKLDRAVNMGIPYYSQLAQFSAGFPSPHSGKSGQRDQPIETGDAPATTEDGDDPAR